MYHHNNKGFDSVLCEKTDPKGRRLLKDLVADLFGATDFVEINESSRPVDGYHDLEAYFPSLGKTISLEVESTSKDHSDRFRYFDTCHVPERKYKHTADLFFVIDDHLAWMAAERYVKQSPVKAVKTQHKLEEFYDVEWIKGQFARKVDGKWHRVRGAKDPMEAKYMPV